MKKIKNNQMGYISSEENRTIFQERDNYYRSLTVIEQTMVAEFEEGFAGNIVNGFSYAKILKSFLIDYQSMIKERSINMSHWFETKVPEVYGLNIVGGLNHNVLFSKDQRYKSLIRTDGKLSSLLYVIGPKIGSSPTIDFLKLYAVTAKASIPQDLNASYLVSITLPPYSTDSLSNFVNTLKMSYSQSGSGYVLSLMSVNSFVNTLKNVIAFIELLETDRHSMNIDGNYDGLASNQYETLLQEQLGYLNNLSDKVAESLINEKITAQAQKDQLKQAIEQKKTDILNAVAKKKSDIRKMNELRSELLSIKG